MKYLGLWSPGLQNFFEKFVKPSGPPSCILNVRSRNTITKVYISLHRHIIRLIYWLFVNHSVVVSSGKLAFIVLVWPQNVIQSIFHLLNGSTNCAHCDKQRARKEVVACTKSHARQSIKTLLSSTPILFKIVSHFCV